MEKSGPWPGSTAHALPLAFFVPYSLPPLAKPEFEVLGARVREILSETRVNAQGAKGLQSGWWSPSHHVDTDAEAEECQWWGPGCWAGDAVKFLSEPVEKHNIKL